MTKKRFDESKAFEHYGMICLALDDIVVDGHVESASPGTRFERRR